MRAHLGGVARGTQHSGQLRADRFIEAHVRDHAISKKCGDAVARAVEKLIGNQKVQRFQFLLQGADGAHGNNSLDAHLLHGVNVGAVVDFRGSEAMPARVPRQEGHAFPFQRSDHQSVGRIAERRFEAHFARLFEAGHVVEAAAADDADAHAGSARAALSCWC